MGFLLRVPTGLCKVPRPRCIHLDEKDELEQSPTIGAGPPELSCKGREAGQALPQDGPVAAGVGLAADSSRPLASNTGRSASVSLGPVTVDALTTRAQAHAFVMRDGPHLTGGFAFVPRLIRVHPRTSPALSRRCSKQPWPVRAIPGLDGSRSFLAPALAASVPRRPGRRRYLLGTAPTSANGPGALKHFFDQVYYPLPDRQGKARRRPCTVHGAERHRTGACGPSRPSRTAWAGRGRQAGHGHRPSGHRRRAASVMS